jgi:hypothetical protein
MALWATLIATFWYAVGPAGGGAVIYAPHLRIRCITLVTHLPTFGSYCRYIFRHPSFYLLTSRHLTPNCSYVTSNSPSRFTCHLPRPLCATFHAPPLVTSHVTFTPPFSRLPRHLSRHFPRHPSRHLLCHFRSRHHFRHHSHCHLLCHLLDTFYATFIDTIYIKTTYYVTSQVTSQVTPPRLFPRRLSCHLPRYPFRHNAMSLSPQTLSKDPTFAFSGPRSLLLPLSLRPHCPLHRYQSMRINSEPPHTACIVTSCFRR